MHFLLLHGVGTSSPILETQSAPLRHELSDQHLYTSVEGTISCPPAPGIADILPSTTGYWAYFDPAIPSTFTTALSQLQTFIEQEGPFDGVMGFSHGAQLAASLLVHQARVDPAGKRAWRCAVFLSGGIPYEVVEGECRHVKLKEGEDRGVIDIPTANIWGKNDMLYPGEAEELSRMCRDTLKEVYVHNGGHEVPSGKNMEELFGAVRAIRRTVERELNMQ